MSPAPVHFEDSYHLRAEHNYFTVMREAYEIVPVKGMTAEDVLTLWHRGELLRKAVRPTDDELLARCRQEALSYVAAIDDYSTPEWRPYIKEVWEAIVNDDAFASGLVMKQKRAMNRYFVTAIVFVIQVKGIYLPVEQVNQLKLHLSLEGVNTKNNILKGWCKYALTLAQRRRLTTLMSVFSTSRK